MNAVLHRTTFETSRELEYFSEKELTAQTGHQKPYWPVVNIRELTDNALDEGAKTIRITVADDCITVTDDGHGIPAATVERSLDFSVRVSNKAHYVAPTRGAMGNALKVIWAAPFVASGTGCVTVTALGIEHRVAVSLDRIAEKPVVHYTTRQVAVKAGTSVKIRWPDSTWLLDGAGDARIYRVADLIDGFAAFNPNIAFVLNDKAIPATNLAWAHWTAEQPTSAHWYTPDSLRTLIAAYITAEPGKTVRDFTAEFRGLSGTIKRKIVTNGWSGKLLADFVVNSDVDKDFVAELLRRMRVESTAPPPDLLGTVGEAHLTAWMKRAGADGVRYARRRGNDENGLPFVMEAAFGVLEDGVRRIVAGVNWSPVVGGFPSQDLSQALSDQRVEPNDPVLFVWHIARPALPFSDRGKTRLTFTGNIVPGAIAAVVGDVTKAWRKAKRLNDAVSRERLKAMRGERSERIRDVAFAVMEHAYSHASSGGRYYANARQIMYAARPTILTECGIVTLDSKYFTQTLLKDYLEEYNPDWKVVWDPRGSLIEPHTQHTVPLGGLGVRRYIQKWKCDVGYATPEMPRTLATVGPSNRFSSVLFIEKEGFAEILTHAGIGPRYDMALMSTKGIPVDAACDLLTHLTNEGVRIFVLHDFDYAGFKILRTLRKGTRLSEGSNVIDLGLRLSDVVGLPSEPVTYKQKSDPRDYLMKDCGATVEEVGFLVDTRYGNGQWGGNRVEINAMTSAQLIAFLERKFTQYGVRKVLPSAADLTIAYRRAALLHTIEREIEVIEQSIDVDDIAPPKALHTKVKALLAEDSTMSWDDAVWQIAEDYSGEVEE